MNAASVCSTFVTTPRGLFIRSTNLTRYIVGSYRRLRPRGIVYWPYPVKTQGLNQIEIARVKYGGNFNPEPLAFSSLKLAADEKVCISPKTVDVGELSGCGAKVAFMTGTDGVSLTGPQKEAIKKYVHSGGTLIVDAAGGSEKFYKSMHTNLRDIFGAMALKPVQTGTPLFNRSKSPIKEVTYRVASRKRIESNAMKLLAVSVKGREAVYLSREDITTGLLGCESGVVDGYTPESAYAIARNIIMSEK